MDKPEMELDCANNEITITAGERAALIHNQMLDFICTVSEMEDLNLDSRQIQKLTIYIMGSWFKGKRGVRGPIDLKRSAKWIMEYFEDLKEEEEILQVKTAIIATAEDTAQKIVKDRQEAR